MKSYVNHAMATQQTPRISRARVCVGFACGGDHEPATVVLASPVRSTT